MDCNPPGSSVHWTLQARYWSGLPFPPPGDLSNPGIEPASPVSPALAGRFLTMSATWEVQRGTREHPREQHLSPVNKPTGKKVYAFKMTPDIPLEGILIKLLENV